MQGVKKGKHMTKLSIDVSMKARSKHSRSLLYILQDVPCQNNFPERHWTWKPNMTHFHTFNKHNHAWSVTLQCKLGGDLSIYIGWNGHLALMHVTAERCSVYLNTLLVLWASKNERVSCRNSFKAVEWERLQNLFLNLLTTHTCQRRYQVQEKGTEKERERERKGEREKFKSKAAVTETPTSPPEISLSLEGREVLQVYLLTCILHTCAFGTQIWLDRALC